MNCVVFQISRYKASGFDGCTLALHHEYWDVIKEDLIKVFYEFRSSWVKNESTNATFISLMPKKVKLLYISYFKLQVILA